VSEALAVREAVRAVRLVAGVLSEACVCEECECCKAVDSFLARARGAGQVLGQWGPGWLMLDYLYKASKLAEEKGSLGYLLLEDATVFKSILEGRVPEVDCESCGDSTAMGYALYLAALARHAYATGSEGLRRVLKEAAFNSNGMRRALAALLEDEEKMRVYDRHYGVIVRSVETLSRAAQILLGAAAKAAEEGRTRECLEELRGAAGHG